MRFRSLRSFRLRLRLLLFSVSAFLLLVGTDLHRRAEGRRREALLERIEALESRLSANEGCEDLKNPSSSFPSNDFSNASIGRQPSETVTFPRPRILCSGRSGSWLYLDVRLPSWEVRRYYLQRTATRAERRRWIRTICADVEDDYYLLSLPPAAQPAE